MARSHVRAIQVEIPHNKANRDAITAKLTEHDTALDRVVSEDGSPVLATPSAPGAMSALDRSRFVYDETLTSVGGAVAYDVVRRVSAGVWTPAQGDTAAHFAGPLGIYTGSEVVPLAGNVAKANFDSTPVVGSGYWISATTAGKFTCNSSSTMRPIGPVIADKSVGAAYAASCGTWQAGVVQVPLAESLLLDTVNRLGGTPDQWSDVFEHCNVLSDSDAKSLRWGNMLGSLATIPSNLTLQPGGGWYANSAPWLPSGFFLTSPWRFSVRMRMQAAGQFFAGITNSTSFGVGQWTGGSWDNSKFYAFASTHRVDGGAMVPADAFVLGNRDNNYHVFHFLSIGDGTCIAAMDGGTYSSPVTLVGDGGGAGTLYLYNPATTGVTNVEVDWFYFAAKLP